MLGLKLNHVNRRGPWYVDSSTASIFIIMSLILWLQQLFKQLYIDFKDFTQMLE